MTAMGPIADPAKAENALQSVVRLVSAGTFLAILGLGPLLQLTAGPARTHASVPFPTRSLAAFRDGDWMRALERHAQELSPVTLTLRCLYNETLFRFGLLDPLYIHLGSEGWMFLSQTLRADPARLALKAEARRRCLESLKRRCDELGVKLLALPAPDKVRIYPERAFPDGQLPPDKEALYGLILREMEEAGIPVLNIEEILQRQKRAPTGVIIVNGQPVALQGPLYYERDSHWTGHAALVVAMALQERFRELGWGEQLGDPLDLVPAIAHVEVVPDLVGSLGFRALAGVFEGSAGLVPSPDGEKPQRISSLVRSLSEGKDFYQVGIKGVGGEPVQIDEEDQRRSKVALCGTSFSQECFHSAVAFDLGRVVDFRGIVVAGGPFKGLEAQLGRIERGESEAVIVVWEMVERSYLDIEWLEPPIF